MSRRGGATGPGPPLADTYRTALLSFVLALAVSERALDSASSRSCGERGALGGESMAAAAARYERARDCTEELDVGVAPTQAVTQRPRLHKMHYYPVCCFLVS